MTTIGFRLISVPSAVSPLSLLSHRPNNDQSQALRHNLPITTSRRGLTMLSFLSAMPSLFLPAPATAFDIGISGPKDWLREQKRKASRFLLAPIEASRGSLHAVYLMLSNDSDYSNKDMEDVQRMLKSAARDCVLKDRNSFVQFQASTGVEVCTFQLIVKNAASLLGNEDPIKLEAESRLKDLVSSFTSLNSLAYETDIQVNSNRQKVLDAVNDTIDSLDKFEKGIKDCLEI
ncbi:uncharacterized protein LOC111805195 isoform X1 [Cucurbita pepo subsp. pepo]|uniref:uncharacterized protein LOC111805195 isoform X1 n=1 Tax=Cucurbita pepo subsp. pepo TaxID=3664 RepID=UPI000C9DA334|nr:uncharacterized protein LOC111805195 isoform X1 [Cucurbita pepo subsp. pepo]